MRRGLYLILSSSTGGQKQGGKEGEAKEPDSSLGDEFSIYLREKGVKQ